MTIQSGPQVLTFVQWNQAEPDWVALDKLDIP
jgi:hypothetical protein